MTMTPVSVHRWSDTGTPDEATLRQRMVQEGLLPYSWSNEPGDVYSAHSHAYHKVIYVVKGAITFGLPELGETIPLVAGDRLDLPAGITHSAVVGNQGVVCLEAQR